MEVGKTGTTPLRRPHEIRGNRHESPVASTRGWRIRSTIINRLGSVKFPLQNIYQRLGVQNRTEASRWYLEQARRRA